jgi:hypothetical protein
VQRSILFVLLISILFSVNAQEKKNKILVTGILTHYINYEREKLGPTIGYYRYSVMPGIEALYSRQIFNNVNVSTGINYQTGKISSYISAPRRFQFQELSVPLLFQKRILGNTEKSLFLTLGIYCGKTININIQTQGEYDNWHNWNVDFPIEGYSDDTFFTDFYFDSGYSKTIKNSDYLSFAPFLKYRINTTWLNYHQRDIHFGIKLIYSFKL